jgi:multidrug resistance efflux pump
MPENPSTLRRPEPIDRATPSVIAGPAQTRTRRSHWQLPLLILGPIAALAIGLVVYFMGGRFVSEENSYIGANTIAIAPQVSGVVRQVSVAQNQQVEADTPLFSLDPEPYRIAVDGARAQLGITHDQIASAIETYKARQQQVNEAQANLTYTRQQPRARSNWLPVARRRSSNLIPPPATSRSPREHFREPRPRRMRHWRRAAAMATSRSSSVPNIKPRKLSCAMPSGAFD